MSFKHPGIIFDASNSWNGYVHQGKVALFEAIKTICDYWDDAKTTADNEMKLSKYFLELEYYEDFSIGEIIDGDALRYLTVHQVKDKEDDKLSSYDSALLGLVQHIIQYPNIESEYLHVTKDLNVSDKELTDHILNIIKAPKFIEDEIREITSKRGDANFRAELLCKKRGRRATLKQNLYADLIELGLEDEGLTEANLDTVFNYRLDILNKSKDEFAAVNREAVEKIKIYSYPATGRCCPVDKVKELVISAIVRFYSTDPEYKDSYKITDGKFHEKCYCFLSEKINEHIRERDLHYHDYKSGLEKRFIALTDIVGWLKSDKIDNFDKDYYLYYVRQNIFQYLGAYCDCCTDKNPCKENCGMEEFKDKLSKMDFDELERFTYFSNPQFNKKIAIESFSDFANRYCYTKQFTEGIKNIERDFLSGRTTVTYHDNDNRECVLTTVIEDSNEANAVCSKILKNKNIYSMMMDSDYLISKNINVESIEDASLSPVFAENTEEYEHIARCKNVKIISLENFLNKINGGS